MKPNLDELSEPTALNLGLGANQGHPDRALTQALTEARDTAIASAG